MVYSEFIRHDLRLAKEANNNWRGVVFQYRLLENKEISKYNKEISIAEINPEMKWKKGIDKNIRKNML